MPIEQVLAEIDHLPEAQRPQAAAHAMEELRRRFQGVLPPAPVPALAPEPLRPAETPPRAEQPETPVPARLRPAASPEAAHAHRDEEEKKYRWNEKAPARFFSRKGFWKATGRKLGFLGAAGTTAAAFSTVEAGSLLSRIPVLSHLANFSEAAYGWAVKFGWGSNVASWVGALLPTVVTFGGLWGLGYLWERFQRDVLHEKIPHRSISKRIWVGATLPFRITGRLAEWGGMKLWQHKWKFAGGLTLGAILATAGFLTPAGAAILGTGGAALSAKFPEEGSASGGGGKSHSA